MRLCWKDQLINDVYGSIAVITRNPSLHTVRQTQLCHDSMIICECYCRRPMFVCITVFYKHQKLYLDEIWQNDGSELTWKIVWVIYNTVHLRNVKKESVWITYIPDEIRKGSFRVPIFIFAILLMLQKTRYSAEEELPPPPSPPQLKEVSALDGVPRPASTERILAETAAQHVILRDDLQQVGTALFLQRYLNCL